MKLSVVIKWLDYEAFRRLATYGASLTDSSLRCAFT
jgi:hypothetical protein